MRLRIACVAASTTLMAAVTFAVPARAEVDWNKVNQEMGRPGADQAGGTKRFSFPRSDLKVMLDGVEVKAGLALGSWLAFQPTSGNDAMVVGDLVLTQDEIAPVMKKLLEGGIDVTAIHNHLLRAEPFPMYMHVEGRGDAVKLATALHGAIALSKTPLQAPAPAAAPANPGFDVEKVATAMGRPGQLDGVIYKYNVARAESIATHGVHVGAAHGTGIAINFQDAGGGKVATTGDFVLLENEVAPVMRILRDNGNRDHGAAQPHAGGRAALGLHALLGRRRSGADRRVTAQGARPPADPASCPALERGATGPSSGRCFTRIAARSLAMRPQTASDWVAFGFLIVGAFAWLYFVTDVNILDLLLEKIWDPLDDVVFVLIGASGIYWIYRVVSGGRSRP